MDTLEHQAHKVVLDLKASKVFRALKVCRARLTVLKGFKALREFRVH